MPRLPRWRNRRNQSSESFLISTPSTSTTGSSHRAAGKPFARPESRKVIPADTPTRKPLQRFAGEGIKNKQFLHAPPGRFQRFWQGKTDRCFYLVPFTASIHLDCNTLRTSKVALRELVGKWLNSK